MQLVFPSLILVVATVFVCSTVLLGRTLGRLRTHHPARWEAMDRPSAVRSSWRGTRAIMRFLVRREWTAIDDPELALLAAHTRRVSIVALWLLALLILWVLLLQLNGVALS